MNRVYQRDDNSTGSKLQKPPGKIQHCSFGSSPARLVFKEIFFFFYNRPTRGARLVLALHLSLQETIGPKILFLWTATEHKICVFLNNYPLNFQVSSSTSQKGGH